MHAGSPSAAIPPSILHQPHRLRRSGFSLVEVTMAIGIIAFAFVALLGLLPAGLSTFRSAIDNNNESRILQSLVGRVQVTDFSELPDMDYSKTHETYYYDEEGSALDTSIRPVAGMEPYRIYAARIFVETAGEREGDDVAKTLNFSSNVIAVFANLSSPARQELEVVGSIDELRSLLKKKKGKPELRVRPVLVSKMDSTRPGTGGSGGSGSGK